MSEGNTVPEKNHGPLGSVLDLAVRFRWGVLVAVALVAALGAYNLTKLPIDAVPDITNNQVQINTVAPALSPAQVESQVTFPVETGLAGIPGLEMTRSISRNGFSQVTAVFSESTDIYFARTQIAERLSEIGGSLPPGAEPSMGPLATGLGEVLMWSVSFEPKGQTNAGGTGWQPDGSFLTPEGERLDSKEARFAYLRSVQDWIISPAMQQVPGVASVDSIGGYEKQFIVQPEPNRLIAYGLSFQDLSDALQKANVIKGANFINRGGEALLVRQDARLGGVEDIRNAVVATRENVPVRVADVATVRIGGNLRTGGASLDGDEVVIGTLLMRIGENSRTVAEAGTTKLKAVAQTLPAGVTVEPVYNRSSLVEKTIATVEKNLTEGALLVIVVLFLLLGNIRAALIAALVIPISMLMAAIGMNRLGVSGNLMSLGALDFGLIVDGAVIIVENGIARLAARQHDEGRLLTLGERLAETRKAAQEMIKPTVYGQAIILLVYAPLLTFTGVEGKTFSPMAITVMLALASAFILSLTFVPAMIALLLRGRLAEREVRVVRAAKSRYEPWLKAALSRPRRVIGVGVAVFAAAALLFGTLGSEFTPQLDEGDFAIEVVRIPSVSVEQAMVMQRQVEKVLGKFPQVSHVFARTGLGEAATDAMSPNASDTYIIMKPRDEWPDPSLDKTKLVSEMEEALEVLLGNTTEFSQPIQLRFNELIAGVKGDVAVKIYGEDLSRLGSAAQNVADVLRAVSGAQDIKVQQISGFPTLDVTLDRALIARYGLNADDVSQTVAIALGGQASGLVFQGDRRFNVVVRLPDRIRNDIDQLRALPVQLPGSTMTVPLGELASFTVTEGPAEVRRENGRRLVVISANVRGRDLGSFVAEAQAKVENQVALPPGASISWGGQFENLQAAQARLKLIVPVCFALILLLLFWALGGWIPAFAVFSAIPMALAGGVFALALRGIPFSISAAVGFIALSGVAVLNGLVMMTAIRQRLDEALPLDQAIVEGALARLRPVLMTALVASLGFVPMALSTGTGAEVQRPLATVVIGGLITATALTLFVLPAIARLVLNERDGDESGPSRWRELIDWLMRTVRRGIGSERRQAFMNSEATRETD